MINFFIPDLILGAYNEVTAELLESYGIKWLICDIDNTLVAYTDPEPTPELAAWLDGLRERGVEVAFVSNNKSARVERFNKTLSRPAFSDCGKPSRKGIRRAIEAMGANKSQTALLGDQLLTDVLAAKRAGLTAFLVPPIQPVENAFFRFKRVLEKPFIRKYYRLKNRNSQNKT